MPPNRCCGRWPKPVRNLTSTDPGSRPSPRKFGDRNTASAVHQSFLDLLTVKFLTGFGQRPQHLLGGIGLVCFFLGCVGITYLTGYWIVETIRGIDPKLQRASGPDLHSRAILLGAQLMSIGFLAS